MSHEALNWKNTFYSIVCDLTAGRSDQQQPPFAKDTIFKTFIVKLKPHRISQLHFLFLFHEVTYHLL